MNTSTQILLTAGLAVLASFCLNRLWPATAPKAPPTQARDVETLIEAQHQRDSKLHAALAKFEQRLDGIEDGFTRRAHPVEAAATSIPVEAAPHPVKPAASQPEFRGMLSKIIRTTNEGLATSEEEELFWRLARTTDLVDESIQSLEGTVGEQPNDTEARMELADAFVAKLLTVPGGPERGIWAAKAEAQWDAVVALNPDHWDAQFTIAYNHSMYPDFLNKTDQAIEGFEKALAIQERQPVDDRRARTYVDLARMHKKKGNADKAEAVLRAGLTRHPNDDRIQKAIKDLRCP